jgi:hypothetical protein
VLTFRGYGCWLLAAAANAFIEAEPTACRRLPGRASKDRMQLALDAALLGW